MSHGCDLTAVEPFHDHEMKYHFTCMMQNPNNDNHNKTTRMTTKPIKVSCKLSSMFSCLEQNERSFLICIQLNILSHTPHAFLDQELIIMFLLLG